MASSNKDECIPNIIPLIKIAYPNENKSHIQASPVTGIPGIDPCCKSSPYPAYDENPSLCEPTACTAGTHDTSVLGSCYDSQTLHQRQCDCDKCIQERLDAEAQGKPCIQHVEGNQWQDLGRKYRDPEVQELVRKMRNSDRVRDSLKWCPTDESLTCVVRKFRQYPVGIKGQAAVHYGAAQDLDYPRQLIHGVLSDQVTPGTKLISPPPLKWFDKMDLDIKESIYKSNKYSPVGKSHDQTLNLPPCIHPDRTAFGKGSDKSMNAGLLINPPKTREEVAQESKCCSALYKMTHGDYGPGEQICRNYDSNFDRTKAYGKPTPCDVAGRYAKKVISSWRSCKPDPPVVNKVYADHVDFRYPKLGEADRKNCILAQVGENFTFGKKSAQERERPIREIIFNRCPNEGAEKASKIMRNLKSWLDKVRKSFRSAEGPELESFYEALVKSKSSCDGKVDWDDMVQAMDKLHVSRTLGEQDFMEALSLVGIFEPKPVDKINYYSLMDLIKGHEDPMFHCKITTLKPYYYPHTNTLDCENHFRTMYDEMTSNMTCPQDPFQIMKEQRIHGMPSVRKDRVPRKIKSTKDFTNYGDDGDAYSLIWPSHYTLNGITCRDAFREMTKEEIAKVLCLAKVDISHEELDCAWKAAEALDPNGRGKVCYQTFREALCYVREEQAKLCNLHIDYSTDCCDNSQLPMEKRKRK